VETTVQFRVGRNLTITVNDKDESPVFKQSTFELNVNENSAAGTVVGSCAAVDPEGGSVS